MNVQSIDSPQGPAVAAKTQALQVRGRSFTAVVVRVEGATDKAFFDALDAEFHFTLDPCASVGNAKCGKFYTIADNGLEQDWAGETVFCNPPYGRAIYDWVFKCWRESRKPGTTVVLLIPARTDTRYFHEFIYRRAREIRFIRGRLRFGDGTAPAPFPSMVVIF